MIASSGTENRDARDLEATADKSSRTTKPSAEIDTDEIPRRRYLTRRLVDGDDFEAGQYGTYFSIFILVIGK